MGNTKPKFWLIASKHARMVLVSFWVPCFLANYTAILFWQPPSLSFFGAALTDTSFLKDCTAIPAWFDVLLYGSGAFSSTPALSNTMPLSYFVRSSQLFKYSDFCQTTPLSSLFYARDNILGCCFLCPLKLYPPYTLFSLPATLYSGTLYYPAYSQLHQLYFPRYFIYYPLFPRTGTSKP